MVSSRGLLHHRLSYNELTLGSGSRAGYSMVPGADPSSSSGSHGGTTWEEVGSHTPLVGQRIVWQGSTSTDHEEGARESNV